MWRAFMVAGLAAGLAGGIAAPAAAQQTFKFGHAAASNHLFNTGLEMFAERVAEKTGDGVVIEVMGNRQLGDDRQLIEGVQLGTIDGALISAPLFSLAAGEPAFDALQLPFLVSDYDQLAGLLEGETGQKMLEGLSDKNMKGLGFYEAGLRHFLTSGDPVTETADFEGLKTRIVPIPLHKATWEAVGTNPVGMAYGEVYSGLETGVIDAVEINLSSIESENLYQNAKNVTLTGHYFWPGVLVMNKARFDALDEEEQAALVEAGRETIGEHYRLAAESEDEVARTLKGKGVTISTLEDLDVMRAKMTPVIEEWRGKDPLIAEFIDAARSGS